MAEITGTTAERATRRRPVRRRVVVGALVCAGVFAAGPVVAYELGYVGRGDRPAAINEDSLDVVYRGQRYSRDELKRFTRDGKALVVVSDAASAREGVVHAFDTEAEAQAWHAANR